MSYNGSGTFSPYTPGNPVVPGTVISSTAFNATISDIAAGLSNAITRDGQSPPSANLPMGGRKHTGLDAGTIAGDSLRWEQLFSQGTEQDIASAATTDIGALNTTVVRITGTTTITSFGVNYNGPRFVRFGGALTLTHNATTLIIPGAANVTTAAGDRAILVPVGNPASGWQVVSYTVAALVPGTASSAATLSGTVAVANGGTGATTEAGARTNLGLDALVVPTGAVMPFAMSAAPTGWLECSGIAVSRTTYAALFAAVGTTYGAGDGSTTFNLPQLRAEFIRGWDNGRGIDSGRVFGSSQNDAFQLHAHDVVRTSDSAVLQAGGYSLSAGGVGVAVLGTGSDTFQGKTAATLGGGTPRTASETRARNVALFYCIKT